MTGGYLSLPLDALAEAVEQERVGALHVVLRPEPVWLSAEEKAMSRKRLRDVLDEAGLLDRHGRIAPELLDWLPVLTTASVEYYGWADDGDRTYGILAASRGLTGLIAIRAGEGVALKPVHRDLLPEALVAELPAVAAGGGRPLAIPVSELAEAAREDLVPSPDIRDLISVLRRPVRGTGELYAGRRDEVHRYTRVAQPLHYADTDWGRYLNYTLGRDDEAHIHLAPGHPTTLVEHLLRVATTQLDV